MDGRKTKSLQGIEQRMESLDRDSLRYHVLESARNFKTSWIELGRALYSVRKLATVKRFLGILKSLKEEIEISKLLPTSIIKEAASLIQKLESELS